jgi:hypothetical protein
MKSFSLKFLFSFFLFLNLSLVSYSYSKAALCDWSTLNSANCFPVSQAESLGIDLDAQTASWSYSYCQDGMTSGLEENVCITPTFSQEFSTCPDSGYNCTLYQNAAPPGPTAGGFLGCTVGSDTYSCCPNQSLIINGRCVALEDWIILADMCCEAGQSSCTTQSGEAGYCSSYNGGFVCQGQGICTPLADDVNLDEPGEQYCNCTLGQGQYFCSLSNSNSRDFSAPELAGCASWASPNTGQCPDTVPVGEIGEYTSTCRDSYCHGVVACISDIPPDFITEYKEHGESCTFYSDQTSSDNEAPHDCNPAEGLTCEPNFNICVYPDNSRGGWNTSGSESSCVWDRECATGVGYNQGVYDDLECVDASDAPCYINDPNNACTCKFPENREYTCEWTPFTDSTSPYFGRPAYCMYGFRSPEELHAADLVFSCEDNCGGLFLQFMTWLSGFDGQHVSMAGFEAGQSDDGTYYTCVTGDFDGSIKNTIESCLSDQGIATVTTGGVGAIIGAMVPGPNLVTIPIAAAGGAKIGSSIFNCAPTISGEVRLADDINACQANLRIEVDLTTEEGDLEGDHDPYFICQSNLDPNGTAYQNCERCMDNEGIWTSIGCIEKDPKGLVSKLITIGTGILGGIFLLRVLAASFMLTTSQGDVKKTSEAKQMITEAIIGVLFIIFSVTILQFIGSDVMRLPGFGG